MGYRTRISRIPKSLYKEIRTLDKDSLNNKYPQETEPEECVYIPVDNFIEELYEFGKYTGFSPPKGSTLQFFDNEDLNSDYDNSDTTLNIVTKDFFKYIIDHYSEVVKEYYKDMITPFYPDERFGRSEFIKSMQVSYNFENNNYNFDFTTITEREQNSLYKILEHIKSFSTEWDGIEPYDIEDGDKITSSWKIEYIIFELVRLYKTFDWDNDMLVYHGS